MADTSRIVSMRVRGEGCRIGGMPIDVGRWFARIDVGRRRMWHGCLSAADIVSIGMCMRMRMCVGMWMRVR